MIGQEQTYPVANNLTLTLPALSEAEIELCAGREAQHYIGDGIHAGATIGFPDPMETFGSTGFIIQPMDYCTARVILVVNEENPLLHLAMHAATYAHMGFTLLMDGATYLCEGRTSTVAKEATAEAPVDTPSGMEVA